MKASEDGIPDLRDEMTKYVSFFQNRGVHTDCCSKRRVCWQCRLPSEPCSAEHLCEVLPSVSPSLSSSLFLHLGLYFLLLAAILIRPIPPFYHQGSTGSMGRVFDGQSHQSNNSALIFGVHSLGRVVVPKAQSPERHINKGLVQDSVPEKVSQMEIPNNSWQVLQRKAA